MKKTNTQKSTNNNNITELVFILDRSGSMSGLEGDTIGGFNAMLNEQKKEEGTAYVSTVLFDNMSDVIHDRLPIDKVPPMTNRDYYVRGCTALLDAIGDAIHHIQNVHKYARPEDVPAKTLFMITTDGYENASRRYTYREIKKMISKKEKEGWEFIFVGANIDAVDTAEDLGIRSENAVNYHADSQGTQVLYQSLNMAVTTKRQAPSCQAPMSADWRKGIDRDFKKRKK